ncbi:MAG: CRISPR-associated endonuclease Cas2 [Candidatus ainarchaeum sp.]|nr:CRISPR-associated endonuclease Cas2 [Candidatus ainarchaeum sp.]
MYLILVYDINVERTTKILKLCRKYLNHIQNSVFEGEITESNFSEFKLKINEIIDKTQDSIIIFRLWDNKYYKKEIIGFEKNSCENLI